MLNSYLATLIIQLFLVIIVHSGRPGPKVVASKGAIWPKPQQQVVRQQYFVLRPRNFKFLVLKTGASCSVLESGLERYFKILQQNQLPIGRRSRHSGDQQFKRTWLQDEYFLGYLDALTVNLTRKCDDDEYPSLDMDESYKLWVTENKTELQASSVWGILRGLESFSQLVYLGDDGLSLRLNSTSIKDFPRYKHRGLLIDTSRHFIPLKEIYLTLDALAYNKMNVLHWHIVDDQSYPYVSRKFPELSDFGAYNRYTKVYYPEDIQNVIEYARIRGVRVLPEFDTPGHTSSWGLSHPELLTPCGAYDSYGPMDPSKNTTYEFLREFFSEVRTVFKDDFVHLGGDEVDFECWEQNVNVTSFMKKHNITTYNALEGYYVQKVIDMVESLGYSSIVWEEVFSNGVKIPNKTFVHVWKTGWTDTMKEVTSAGKYALLSACWYLDHLASGGDWEDFYYCDPKDFGGTPKEQKLVFGGEACMWGEVVNEFNIISRVWPRASATAEKLWSAYSGDYSLDEPAARLEEHTCRMNRRGIAAEPPNGPGFCD